MAYYIHSVCSPSRCIARRSLSDITSMDRCHIFRDRDVANLVCGRLNCISKHGFIVSEWPSMFPDYSDGWVLVEEKKTYAGTVYQRRVVCTDGDLHQVYGFENVAVYEFKSIADFVCNSLSELTSNDDLMVMPFEDFVGSVIK